MFAGCCCADTEAGGFGGESLVKSMPQEEGPEALPDIPIAAKEPTANVVEAPAEIPEKEEKEETDENTSVGDDVVGATFSVTIERHPKDPIGLDIDCVDGESAVLVGIKDGAVQAWNNAHPGSALRPLDRIIEVNGVGGTASSVVSQLKSDATWDLVVQRPVEFAITLARKDAPGIDLRYASNANTLLIGDVSNDGPLSMWNIMNSDKAVAKHDRIVELNGVRGAAAELLKASNSEETMQLVVAHYA